MDESFHGDDDYSSHKRKDSLLEDDSYECSGQDSFSDAKSYGGKKRRRDKGSQDVVFSTVDKPKKPRKYTLSIAVPASILDATSIKDELRTYVVGQIARAAVIYSVDEIVVYDDGCAVDSEGCLEMMKILLQYQELPQYLRKYFFGFNKNLRCVGLLNPLNSPHHLKYDEWCEYREGVILKDTEDGCSYADVGLQNDILVDRKLEESIRVTVKFQDSAFFDLKRNKKKITASVVSPSEPRVNGYYWGYSVRVAKSLAQVVTGCPYEECYDLIIGTSDKGDDAKKTTFTEFSHALILFGGVEGLEKAIEGDSKLRGSKPSDLFHHYLNTCMNQQTNTIRTEEAVLISLCVLRDKLVSKGKK